MVDVLGQLVLSAYLLVIGIVVGIIYVLLGKIKLWAKNNVFVNFALDFCLFFVTGIVIFLTFFHLNFGKIAFFGIICFAIGFVVSRFAFEFLFKSIFNLIKMLFLKLRSKRINTQ